MFTIILIPRLKIAIATIKVAVDSLKAVPSLMLFPLAGGLAISGFMVWWVAVAIFVYSSGKMTKRDCCASVQSAFSDMYPSYVAMSGPPSCDEIHCGYQVEMNDPLRYSLIYHGFEFLWTTQFIVSFSILTVSQVVYKCYLAAGDAGVQLPAWPLGRAVKVTIRYYLGTIALGSLVVASVQFFRYCVMYAMQKVKKIADSNKLVKVLLWLVNCLLWLLQKIVELISHSAYAIVAMEDVGFCSAAATATSLLAANALRFGVLAVVSDAILFLGKLGTAASSAFFTFVYLDKTYPDGTLSSPLVPVIVVFLTAFAIASVAFGVVEQAVQTTLLAMCDDEAKHGGEAKWAPHALKEALGAADAHSKEVEAKAAQKKGCCTAAPAADA